MNVTHFRRLKMITKQKAFSTSVTLLQRDVKKACAGVSLFV